MACTPPGREIVLPRVKYSVTTAALASGRYEGQGGRYEIRGDEAIQIPEKNPNNFHTQPRGPRTFSIHKPISRPDLSVLGVMV